MGKAITRSIAAVRDCVAFTPDFAIVLLNIPTKTQTSDHKVCVCTLFARTVLHKDLAFPEQLREQCQLQLEVLELFPQETFRGVSSRKMALFPEREIFMQHPPESLVVFL